MRRRGWNAHIDAQQAATVHALLMVMMLLATALPARSRTDKSGPANLVGTNSYAGLA